MPLAALSTLLISPPLSLGDSHVEKRLAGPFDVTDEDFHQWWHTTQPQAELGDSKVQGWTLWLKELCLKTKWKSKHTWKRIWPGNPNLAQQQSTSYPMQPPASIQSCKITKTDKWSLWWLLACFLWTSKCKIPVNNLLLTFERFYFI